MIHILRNPLLKSIFYEEFFFITHTHFGVLIRKAIFKTPLKCLSLL